MLSDREGLGNLSDRELIRREAADRFEFLLMPRVDPRATGTTYRVISIGAALLDAWRRWTASSGALTRRGLRPQGCLQAVRVSER